MADARKTALDALIKITDGGYSNIVVSNILDKSNLSERDKAFSSAVIYGVLERSLTLDYILSQFSTQKPHKLSKYVKEVLRIGIYQMIFMDKIPDSAAVNESVKLIKKTKDARFSGFVNGVLRNISRASRDKILDFSSIEPISKRLSLTYSVPQWLTELFLDQYGADFTEQLLDSFNKRHTTVLRVNTLKTTPGEYMEALNKGGIKAVFSSICDTAIELDNCGSVSSLPGYEEGFFHVQDTASQLCAKAVGAKEGMSVLDLCAAPGGKSFTVSQEMKNSGSVSSLDVHENKLSLINDGAEKLGISIIKTGCNDASVENESLGLFDRVLCDVPCSGLGIISKKPEIRYKNVVILDFLPDLQYRILCNAAKHVKLGGVLVYSTCTLNKAENQDVIERFMKEHPEFIGIDVLSNVKRVFNESKNMITLFPNIHNTDGFFISALMRTQ